MKSFIALALVLALTAVTCTYSEPEPIERNILKNFEAGDAKTLFKVYHLVYKKSYTLNSEEGIRRYKIFKKNWAYIQEENKKGYTYTLGLTKFVDFTPEELKSYTNEKPGQIDAAFEEIASEAEKSNTQLSQQEIQKFFDSPDEDEMKLYGKLSSSETQIVRNPIDWRSYMTPVRDQGNCGSCWAFGTAAVMEGNFNIKNKITSSTNWLSTQQLVDCDTNSSGCDGGWGLGAIYYYSRLTGLVSEKDYSYTSEFSGLTGTCKNDVVSNINVKKTKSLGMEYCQTCNIDQWYSILAKGPILISSYSNDNWYYYTGGVFSITGCNSTSSNHAVVAVGWGKDTTGEYTIVRNSWGSSWGERGYIRIKYQPEFNASCFINLRATRPTF
jgi:C1A family cysteine protease